MTTVEENECGQLQHISGYLFAADYSLLNYRVRTQVQSKVREDILKNDLATCHSFHLMHSMRLQDRGYFSGKDIRLCLDKVILEQTAAILTEKGLNRPFCLFQSPGLTSQNGWTVAFMQRNSTGPVKSK